jgi:TRAP-type mannitol/chloroaromatic compound transport system permease small subunit
LLYYFSLIPALAQQIWNMTDISGDEYSLGLYHGEESGHLMVYLNESILIIDFKILNDKTYHFYIGHELMELKISKRENDYVYTLEADVVSGTPYNIALQKSERTEQNNIMIGLTISILLLATILILRNFT